MQIVSHEFTTDAYRVVTLAVEGSSGYFDTIKKPITIGSAGPTHISTYTTIDYDATWDASRSPYILNAPVTVAEGATLTLSSGTIVKFGLSGALNVSGTLIADGTESDQIVFTSFRDDTAGGDTNDDGDATSPAAGDWTGLYFAATSINNVLDQVVVRYANQGINAYTSSLTVSNATLSDNSNGLYVASAASPTITGSTISGNNYGVFTNTGASPTISGNTFMNNGNAIGVANSSRPTIIGNDFSNGRIYLLDPTSSGAVISGNTNLKSILIGSGGSVPSDAIWTSDSPYILNAPVSVAEGATLTLSPGTIVKGGFSDALNVSGTLIADGTESDQIVFTSFRDDTAGGDTNDDGDATSPAAGDWTGLYFAATSINNVLDQVVVRYANQGINAYTSSLTVSNATLSDNSNGLYVASAASPTITGSTISGNNYGVFINTGASPTISGNTFMNNGNAIGVANSSRPTIIGNDFSNGRIYLLDPTSSGAVISGNTNLKSILIGSGGSVPSDAIWTSDSPYILNAPVSVAEGATLTLSPGTIVKGGFSDALNVSGTLIADGTESDQIVFTSFRDDTAGGDTNDDGDATSPAAGDWTGLYFAATSINNVLDQVVVRYANQGINAYTSSLTVSNATLSDNSNGLYVASAASPTITGSTISGNNYGVFTNTGASPTISGNTFMNNGNAIGVANSSRPTIIGNDFSNGRIYLLDPTSSGAVISGNTNLKSILIGSGGSVPSDAIWTSDSPYILNAPVSVAEGATLTLSPGTIVKGGFSDALNVSGTLIADGTESKPIIFTSYRDDTAGGDTNDDGDATTPAAGNWNGLYFADTSINNVLDQVVVRYANRGINAYTSYLTVSNATLSDNTYGLYAASAASPTITGSTISGNSYGIYNTSNSILVNAIANFWGDPTGPYDPSDDTLTGGLFNPDGAGDRVSDFVYYIPWISDLNDIDIDEIPDDWEILHFNSLAIVDEESDYDGDGLRDINEYLEQTNPKSIDSDDDGMPDGWEVDNVFNPLVNDAFIDSDNDRYCNLREYLSGSNPNNIFEIPGILADFDLDGDVDGVDFIHFAGEFGRSDCENNDCEYDLFCDGVVNKNDLFLFAEDLGRID